VKLRCLCFADTYGLSCAEYGLQMESVKEDDSNCDVSSTNNADFSLDSAQAMDIRVEVSDADTDSYSSMCTSHNVGLLSSCNDHVSISRSRSQSTSAVENYISCTVCQKTVHCNSLLRHMRLHTGERPFACDMCEMRFIQKNALERHKRMHIEEQLFACDACDVQLCDESELRTHDCIESVDKRHFYCTERLNISRKRSHVSVDVTGHQYNGSTGNYVSCRVCRKTVHCGSLTRHMRLHTGERLFACDVCKMRFFQKSGLERHKHTHTGERSFVCGACDMQFHNESEFITHACTDGIADEHHSNCTERLHVNKKRCRIPVDISIRKSTRAADKFLSCILCEKIVSRHNLPRHMRFHISGRQNSAHASCTVCQKVVHCSSLTRHMRLHTGERPFACDMCKMRFFQKSGLERHKRIHIAEQLFACDAYDTQFSDESELNSHTCTGSVDEHKSNCTERLCINKKLCLVPIDVSGYHNTCAVEKYVSCALCQKIVHRQSLRRHMRLHVIGRQSINAHISCSVCQKVVHCNSLPRHMRLHTGERPFSCDVCKMQFNHKSRLQIHKRTHIVEQPFAYDTCNTQFTNESELDTHKCTADERYFHRTEGFHIKRKRCNVPFDISRPQNTTGVEKYVSCIVCQKTVHCNSLMRHMRLHTGERPFTCNVCEMQFIEKSKLKTHKLTHNGEQFAYDTCSMNFSDES